MADVHSFISNALQEGHPIEDIVTFLGESEDPTEKAWADRWKATAAAPEYQPGAGLKPETTQGGPSTGLLEKVDQLTPAEVGAAVVGTGLALKAPSIYQDIQANKIANRKLDIEARKADLYAQQVGKQGMAPVAEPNVVPELTGAAEAPKLSPLEEARINTERARAEAIQAKIALEERKIALAEQKAKAAEEAKAAAASTQKSTASGAVAPQDRQMLNSSEKAKMDKAIIADQKAATAATQAAQAVQPPVAPVAPAAPVAPTTPQTTVGIAPPEKTAITLTPSAEVKAEVVPTEAVPEAAPKPAGSVPPKAKEKKTFAKIEELPKEMQFKAGVGGGDSWLHDTVGPDVRKFIIDEFNGGKPIGGGQAGMDKAYGLVGKYEEWLKGNIPEQTLTRAERKAAGIPPAKQYGPLGKTVKVAGAAGLLMTAAQAANAKEAARNVGEALLPIGATPTELAPGTLTEKQLKAFEEAQKLGSPYRSVPPPKR